MGLFDKLFAKKRAEEKARKDAEEREAEERAAQRLKETEEFLAERRKKAEEEARKVAEAEEKRKAYIAAKKQAEENFRNILLNLPSIEIHPSDKSLAKRSFTAEMEQITFSNITTKTNREKLSNFVVIDTETTGLKAGTDEITDVAAIRFRNWQPVEKFISLCSTKFSLSDEVVQLTGITNEMLDGKPKFGTIAGQLTEFIGNDNIVGHNLEFDLKFLIKGGVDFLSQKRKYYDTLTIAQHTLKKIKTKWDKEYEMYCEDYDSDFDVVDHKLSTLCKYYGIVQVDAHRAENDALATGVLLQYLSEDRK